MKRFDLLVGVLAIFFTVAAGGYAKDHVVEVSSKSSAYSIPLGDCEAGQQVKLHILLKNIANEDFNIVEVRPSCGCLSLDLESKLIEANRHANATIEVSIPIRSGPFRSEITLFANNHANSVKIAFEGNSLELLSQSPRERIKINREGHVSSGVKIQSNFTSLDIKQLHFKALHDDVKVVKQHLIDERTVFLDLRVDSRFLEAAGDTSTLMIAAQKDGALISRIPIDFFVEGRFAATPSVAVFEQQDGIFRARLIGSCIGYDFSQKSSIKANLINESAGLNVPLTVDVRQLREGTCIMVFELPGKYAEVPQDAYLELRLEGMFDSFNVRAKFLQIEEI